MITGFFLRIFYVVFEWFVSILPTVPFPIQVTQAITTIGGYLNAWTYIFPVGTLFAVLSVAFVFHFAVMGWHYGHLILRYLRGR